MGTATQRLTEVRAERPAGGRHATVDQCVTSGDLLFVSGQVAFDGERQPLVGEVGTQVTTGQAAKEAAACAANALHRVAVQFGDLDVLDRLLKVTVFVNAAGGFRDHPTVADGASDLLVNVLGDAGRHARSAVGVASLPLGVPVEVELIARLRT